MEIKKLFLYDGLRASTICFHSPTWIDFRISKALKSNQCFLLNIFCFRFYITGYRVFNFWLHPPTWIGFGISKALKSNQCFLLNVFCFFPPVESALISFRASFLRRILLYAWGRRSRPHAPLMHSQLKMWVNGTQKNELTFHRVARGL